MNPDEINNLMQVMSNKINQLTQQNIMLESKVMYLNSVLQQMQNSDTPNDGGTFDETPPVEQNNGKTKQQVRT
jgi:hypothetical protein